VSVGVVRVAILKKDKLEVANAKSPKKEVDQIKAKFSFLKI